MTTKKTSGRATKATLETTVPATTFRSNLYRMRIARGWSQSDLAKMLWGTITDSRGYETARGKDSISRWEKGSVPGMSNLSLLAETFGVSIEELAPDLVAKKMGESEAPAVSMTMVAGRPDMVRLVVNTFTTLAVASKIVQLLSADPHTAKAT